MRFKRKIIDIREKRIKTFFAFFPITINGETRWLEKVTIEGHYYIGAVSGKLRFYNDKFL